MYEKKALQANFLKERSEFSVNYPVKYTHSLSQTGFPVKEPISMYSKNLQASIPGLALIVMLLVFATSQGQPPAQGANKFLGNITTNGRVRSDFLNYWNQITGENEHKWQSVERSRDVMNWGGGDAIARFADQNGIPWKFHTLVWGSQYPQWITGLSQAEQLAEITEWFDATKARYPDVQMIDVVNEAHPNHAPAPFKNALGGDGATGFDWIIKSFHMARERWPNAILLYNDYNNCEYNDEVNWTVRLINAMKQANAPIDAIGCQAHDAFKLATSTVKNNIDKLAATGLPIFITEYDIGEGNDATQQRIMQEQFTMFWNHPKIVGITYWGYMMDSTWRANTGLKWGNGTERPALTWLMDYVKNNPNPPNDFPDFLQGGNSNFRLIVSTKGQGIVTTTPEESSYPEGTPVTLTATPSEGWVFHSWTGEANGNHNPLQIILNKTTEITANFATSDGKEDLIANGTFGSGSDSWSFNNWSGDGAGSVVNGEYRLTVTSVATNYYDIQVVQAGILLEQGKTYRLVYDAYASSNRILNVNVGMPVDPWTSFLTRVDGQAEVNLTTSKQTFSFDFTMENPTYEDSRVEFSVGLHTPAVYIDNVSLFEVQPTAALMSVQKAKAEKVNLRTRGSLLFIDFNSANNSAASLSIYDLNGSVVRTGIAKFESGTQRCTFNMTGLPNGCYVVKIHNNTTVQKAGFVLTERY